MTPEEQATYFDPPKDREYDLMGKLTRIFRLMDRTSKRLRSGKITPGLWVDQKIRLRRLMMHYINEYAKTMTPAEKAKKDIRGEASFIQDENLIKYSQQYANATLNPDPGDDSGWDAESYANAFGPVVTEDEPDPINPPHYKKSEKEVWQMMVDIWGTEAFRKHCEMTAFKYRMRAGSKPGQPAEQDLEKAEWYEQKAKELKIK
jgi:hypothetical protein